MKRTNPAGKQPVAKRPKIELKSKFKLIDLNPLRTKKAKTRAFKIFDCVKKNISLFSPYQFGLTQGNEDVDPLRLLPNNSNFDFRIENYYYIENAIYDLRDSLFGGSTGMSQEAFSKYLNENTDDDIASQFPKKLQQALQLKFDEEENKLVASRNANIQKAAQSTGGALNIAFLPVGQGDCTLFTTPAGYHFVIDCGSDGNATVHTDNKFGSQILRDLRDQVFNGNKHLSTLILTHSDTDHYNKIDDLFKDYTFSRVYHSGRLNQYTNLSTYLKNAIKPDANKKYPNYNNYIKRVFMHFAAPATTTTTKVSTQTHIANANKLAFSQELTNNSGSKISPSIATTSEEFSDLGLLIHKEANCSVYILSGGANNIYVPDKSNLSNRGSLVVLIIAFNKKILVCGDATHNTEIELLARYGDKIKDIDILRVGHHGSGSTSSLKEFINHTAPRTAWFSVGMESPHSHPDLEVILRCSEKTTINTSKPTSNLVYYCGEPKSSRSLDIWLNNTKMRPPLSKDDYNKLRQSDIHITAIAENDSINLVVIDK